MTRPTRTATIIAAAAITAAALLWLLLPERRGAASISDQIHRLREKTVPMRLKIIARSDGTPQIAVKFYDMDDKAVGRCELPYAGGAIAVSILDIETQGRHIYFPDEMRQHPGAQGDTIRHPLRQYYEKDGRPMIYTSQTADPALAETVGRLYGHVAAGDTRKIQRMRCTVRQTTVTLGQPMERVNYPLTARAGGGVNFED